MRTLCDACESAAAIVFCAADEAALCRACDEKVAVFFFPFCVLISWILKSSMIGKLSPYWFQSCLRGVKLAPFAFGLSEFD